MEWVLKTYDIPNKSKGLLHAHLISCAKHLHTIDVEKFFGKDGQIGNIWAATFTPNITIWVKNDKNSLKTLEDVMTLYKKRFL